MHDIYSHDVITRMTQINEDFILKVSIFVSLPSCRYPDAQDTFDISTRKILEMDLTREHADL